jgi:hypothetical protein
MIEHIHEQPLADWFAICNTPDSRLYQRLTKLGLTQDPDRERRPGATDELLLNELDEL